MTAIQHHGFHQVKGMSFMHTIRQSSFYDCTNIMGVKELCPYELKYLTQFKCIINLTTRVIDHISDFQNSTSVLLAVKHRCPMCPNF